MDITIRESFDRLHSSVREIQSKAYVYQFEVTLRQVEWAYDVWDDLLDMLPMGDNHQRTVAARRGE